MLLFAGQAPKTQSTAIPVRYTDVRKEAGITFFQDASVMSQSDLRLHFGVGKAQTIDVMEVKWPTTQKIERFTAVKVNQILTIREGSGIVSPVTLKPK